MKKLLLTLSILALLGLASTAYAQSNLDTLTINFEVQAINVLDIAADEISLIIDAAVAGQQPTNATDGTTYAVTTNSAKKITGSISANMPEHVTLRAGAAAPAGGTSTGSQVLTMAAVDLVTGVSQVAQSGMALNFSLAATVEADVMLLSSSRTFTMTLTD